MIEKFRYEGVWYTPDDVQDKHAGVITISQEEGAILKVQGSFKKDIKIILGEANGKLFTLYKCLYEGMRGSSPGIDIFSYYANIVLVGAHFNKPEEIKFNELSINYFCLDEWVDVKNFDEIGNEEEIIIKYQIDKPINIVSLINCNISINFATNFLQNRKEVSLTRKTFLTIRFFEETPFEVCRNTLYHLQNFLSLVTTHHVFPMKIYGIKEKSSIEFFYKLYFYPNESNINMDKMLFTYSLMKEKLGSLLHNWFSKEEQLRPMHHLYFGSLYNPYVFYETEFLFFIQAIEAYHRRTKHNYELSKKEHEERIAEIIKSVPQKYAEWLKTQLIYSNELRLRRRLEELFDMLPEETSEFIRNKKKFIQKIINLRNYLTHYDNKTGELPIKGMELICLVKHLKIILETFLLIEIGFDSIDMKKTNFFYKRLSQELGRYYQCDDFL